MAIAFASDSDICISAIPSARDITDVTISNVVCAASDNSRADARFPLARPGFGFASGRFKILSGSSNPILLFVINPPGGKEDFADDFSPAGRSSLTSNTASSGIIVLAYFAFNLVNAEWETVIPPGLRYCLVFVES